MDEKSYKNIPIYYIQYVTINEYLNIQSVNPFYFTFRDVNGYFEEITGNKCLTLVPTNKSKEKIKKYEKLGIKIIDLIRSITKNSDDYDEKYIRIKFDSDDELPLNQAKEIPTIIIVVRTIFLENNKCYHTFSQMNICIKYK